MFTPTHIATIGPSEYPTRIDVVYIRPHDMHDFHIVRDKDNRVFTMHRHKLRSLPADVPLLAPQLTTINSPS